MKRIKLTESQLHRLIQTAINEETDKEALAMGQSLIGKKVYTPWSGKQTVTNVKTQLANTLPYAEKDEEGYVFVFYCREYGPFMNLNTAELRQLLQDSEMDGIILVNKKETEDWLDEHDRYLAENPPQRN